MESNLSFIIDISEELRRMVLNKLPQEEVLTLRCVCPQLKHEVDVLYDFRFNNSISLHNKTLKTFPKIRITKYSINRLSFLPLYSNPPTTLFAFPHEIRSLLIETNKIRSTDYRSLLEECCNYLEEFFLDIDKKTNYSTDLKPCITFKNLSKLEINDYRSHFVVKDVFHLTAENDIYLNIVENIDPTSSLKVLVVKIGRKGVEEHKSAIRYIQALFLLIAQHQNSLQVLHHKYSNPHLQHTQAEKEILLRYSVDDVRFTCLKNLINVHVHFYWAVIPVCWITSWKFMTRQQKNLRLLSLQKMDGLLDYEFLQTVISQNFKTLREVIVVFLDTDANANLNMEVFRKCKNLKKLTLFGPALIQCQLKNFTLPKSLKFFKLCQFGVIMDELNAFFVGRTRIKEVELSLENYNANEVINGSIIQRLLGQGRLLRFCLSSYNFRINEQDIALAEILNKYYPNRLPSRHLIIRLFRNLPTHNFQVLPEK